MHLFFAGSFNPFTLGHASIVERALPLCSRLTIAIGYNVAKPPTTESLRGRLDFIRSLYAGQPKVEVMIYEGLTATAARDAGADALLRGVRSVADFEYERSIADINRRISGLETVLLFTTPELASVSSSVVRELESHGYPTDSFLPQIPS
ncbi:MAG: pantetheine-phosphate adenylyltransferase [Duncaniella sp.]|nr:pantetheine-phosphate adenylyltransferase [Duncaniella sp.]